MNRARLLSMFGIAALAFALPFSAGAAVKKEGNWPVVEKKVDLEFEGKPSDGLKQLAKKADWSLVITNGVTIDGAEVHVDVEDVPADAVLEALFVNADVVAHRNGKLITVTPAAGAPASDAQAAATATAPQPPPDTAATPPPPVDTAAQPPPLPTAPTAPPVPTVRGEDRDVIGGRLVIHKDEIVHTVTVTGGSLKVEGTVTGDLVVMGGAAKVAKGGRVIGNATVMGGSLKIEKDGRVDGDVAVVGGSLKREKGAIIGGHVIDDRHHGRVTIRGGDEDATDAATETSSSGRSRLSAVVHELGHSLTKMALLFVLGCVLLALAAPRMEKLRVEVAARPMRSFALGVLSAILGSLGGLVLATILCVTIIGIPVAIAGILFVVLALYGAIASVLTTFGAAVAGHRTQNPYVHLLIGCAAFFLLSSIPWIGGIVTFVVAMIALGALVATRAGGLFDRHKA